MIVLRIAALLAALSTSRAVQPPPVAVLVELFTSEGCSSCPAADALLERLQRGQPIEGVEVIPVGLHVDYFNQLGWKDAFSSAAFTRRQREYSTIFGPDSVYTPQIVVDGREAVTGSDNEAVRSAIASAATRPHLPLRVVAAAAGDRVRLTIDLPQAPDAAEPIHAVAAITEDDLTTAVKRGENHGRTLHHVAVARSVQRVGALAGMSAALTVDLPLKRGWDRTALRAVVWLEGDRSRGVYGAASARLTR